MDACDLGGRHRRNKRCVRPAGADLRQGHGGDRRSRQRPGRGRTRSLHPEAIESIGQRGGKRGLAEPSGYGGLCTYANTGADGRGSRRLSAGYHTGSRYGRDAVPIRRSSACARKASRGGSRFEEVNGSAILANSRTTAVEELHYRPIAGRGVRLHRQIPTGSTAAAIVPGHIDYGKPLTKQSALTIDRSTPGFACAGSGESLRGEARSDTDSQSERGR